MGTTSTPNIKAINGIINLFKDNPDMQSVGLTYTVEGSCICRFYITGQGPYSTTVNITFAPTTETINNKTYKVYTIAASTMYYMIKKVNQNDPTDVIYIEQVKKPNSSAYESFDYGVIQFRKQ